MPGPVKKPSTAHAHAATSTHSVAKSEGKKTPAVKPKKPKAPETTVAEGLAHTAAAAKKKPTAGVPLEKLVAEDKAVGVKVVDVVKTPTAVTALSAKFSFGGYEGRMLNPGEEIMMQLPAHLRDRPVRNVILVHRKDSAHDSGKYTRTHDDSPALTAVHIHAKNLPANQAWRHWEGPWGSSGPEGAKFAEKRGAGDPEFETEFNWPEQGHAGVESGSSTTKFLFGDAARVKALGDDPSFVHSVEIQVVPPKPSETAEIIFSPGTKMGDPETLEGHQFGGGQGHGGKFPGALELSGWGSGGAGAAKLSKGWHMENGRLTYDLPAGKRITGVDIACGDTHPDGVSNKDGGTGTPGWSRLTMALVKASGELDAFMSSQGVPPEGILTGAPSDVGYVTKAGDKISISASSDTTYVMGVRIGFLKK